MHGVGQGVLPASYRDSCKADCCGSVGQGWSSEGHRARGIATSNRGSVAEGAAVGGAGVRAVGGVGHGGVLLPQAVYKDSGKGGCCGRGRGYCHGGQEAGGTATRYRESGIGALQWEQQGFKQ